MLAPADSKFIFFLALGSTLTSSQKLQVIQYNTIQSSPAAQQSTAELLALTSADHLQKKILSGLGKIVH